MSWRIYFILTYFLSGENIFYSWEWKQVKRKIISGETFLRNKIQQNFQKHSEENKKKKKFKSFFYTFLKEKLFLMKPNVILFFFLNRCFFWNQVGKKFCRFRFFRFIFHIFTSFILSAIALIRYLLRYSARCDRSTRSTKYLLYIHVNIRIIYSNTTTFIARISLLTYGLLGFWVK